MARSPMSATRISTPPGFGRSRRRAARFAAPSPPPSTCCKRNPDFRFAQSFAEYYRQLEDDDPALLELVRAQVAAGGWAPAGGLWVEPDINMPCGESLVRQALYGQLHFERTFGRRHTQRAGCPTPSASPPALPQILKGAGLTSLFTIKIGWSETNRFPHTRFWWEGIDGSRVLVQHVQPAGGHLQRPGRPGLAAPRLAQPHATSAGRARCCSRSATATAAAGPTAEMIAAQRRARRLPAAADDPVRQRPRPTSSAPRPRPQVRRSPTWVGRALSRVPPRRPDQPGPHQAPAPPGRARAGRRRGAGRRRRSAWRRRSRPRSPSTGAR